MKAKLACAVIASWLAVSNAIGAAAQKAYPFFPFCIDWHDAKKRSFEQQAEMLKSLGYDGVGHIGLDKVAERLKTLDAVGLRLFQITMTVDVSPGKQPYDPRFKEVLSLVKGRNVQFLLMFNGMKPSDAAVDPRRQDSTSDVGFWPAAPAPSCFSTRTRAVGSSGSRTRSAWPTRSIARTSA